MRRDNHYLEDIRIATDLISEFVAGMSLKEYETDKKTRAAVEREMITIGEATSRITKDFKDAHPDVPWATLIKLRNFYTHGYDRLKPDQVWGTVKRLIPKLGTQVVALIEPEDDDS